MKVLRDALVRDRERLARFEREAKVLASLNLGRADQTDDFLGIKALGAIC